MELHRLSTSSCQAAVHNRLAGSIQAKDDCRWVKWPSGLLGVSRISGMEGPSCETFCFRMKRMNGAAEIGMRVGDARLPEGGEMGGCHDGFQLVACFGHVRGAAGLPWVSAEVRHEDQPETKLQPFSQMFLTPVHFSLRLDGFPLKMGSIEPVEGIDKTATGCPGKSPVPYTRHRLCLYTSPIALVVLLSTWPACGGRSCLREPSHKALGPGLPSSCEMGGGGWSVSDEPAEPATHQRDDTV
jgi:hypothetical protein